MIKKSISEWEEIYDIFIIGYQGFPNKTDKSTMFTRTEFLNGCLNSTLKMNGSFAVTLGNHYESKNYMKVKYNQ